MVMLIVAADESIKPQTREHFDICKLLGIPQGLTVITKSDLVDREVLDLVRLEVQEFVAGSFLANAPVVAVSARTGEGLDALRNELRRLSLETSPKPTDLPFRLPIDRSFVMKGFGAVVTGTLIAGTVTKDSEVEIFPLGKRLRVRGIEVYNSPANFAVAGQRTALNLVGVEAQQITRGMVLASPGLFEPTRSLDCTLNLLPDARPLKNQAQVHFHCGTAEMLARVVLLEGKEMQPGGAGFVQLRLSEPGLFVPGDRFIIRQFSPVTTIGGGAVLDNAPPRHRPGERAAIDSLRILECGKPEDRLELLVRRAGEATPAVLAARTGWKLGEIVRVAKLLEAQKRLMLMGQPPALLVHCEQAEALTNLLLATLGEFHAANPLAAGLPKEELRTNLTSRRSTGPASQPSNSSVSVSLRRPLSTPSMMLFNALLHLLATQGKVEVQGEAVRLSGHTVHLSAEEVAARDQIAAAFEKAGLAVPSAQEVLANLRLDRARAEKLLRILLKENVLQKVTEGLIFHQSALTELRRLLARRKAQNNRLSVPDFKELTGLSRKYAIPLLEYLDRERLTRRAGDERIIL
jgi:selenocysteine-specific elongation factor